MPSNRKRQDLMNRERSFRRVRARISRRSLLDFVMTPLEALNLECLFTFLTDTSSRCQTSSACLIIFLSKYFSLLQNSFPCLFIDFEHLDGLRSDSERRTSTKTLSCHIKLELPVSNSFTPLLRLETLVTSSGKLWYSSRRFPPRILQTAKF